MHHDRYIDKCTFCHHRVEVGLDPACVSTCPTRCMHFGSLDDPDSEVRKLIRDYKGFQLHPEYDTDPSIFYIDKGRRRAEEPEKPAIYVQKSESEAKA